MKFFKRKSQDKKIIFIVEDNEVYAKSLQEFLITCFPDIKEIKTFRIGEMCLMEMHRSPNIVIMDYFLNSKYKDAYNGLETIKQIKVVKPQTNIILLSSQEKLSVILEAIKQYDCYYLLKKDQEAFYRVKQCIIEIFNREKSPAYKS
ncbi:MAG: response regulator [Bacteroidales bacterium]